MSVECLRHTARARFSRAVVAIAAGLVVLSQSFSPAEARDPRPPKRVSAVTVTAAPYSKTTTLTGEIAARNEAALSFKVAGRVTEVAVDVGRHVKAGTVLARIDPTEQRADVASATAAVASATAQLKNARSAFERQKKLLASGFTTRSEYDSADKALKTAQGALESADAQLASAKSNLADTVLKAEADGVITAREVDPGQVVGAAQRVFSFARDGNRDAVFEVQEQLLTRAPSGAVAVSLLSDPDVTTSGHIREVSPLINPNTGTVKVKVGLDTVPERMQLGAAVAGSIEEAVSHSVIQVPWRALMAAGGEPAVWVIDPADNTVSLRPIKIERYDSSRILVAGGLSEGERVVTDGAQMLRPGEAVDIVGREEEAR